MYVISIYYFILLDPLSNKQYLIRNSKLDLQFNFFFFLSIIMDFVIGESEVQQYANPVLESAYFISKVPFVMSYIKINLGTMNI